MLSIGESEMIAILSTLSLQRDAAAYILSNPSILDRVLPHCSPATLIRLSRVCRALHAALAAHISRRFDINKHLGRFFDNPLRFRSLQARTGALISGSNALQFFAEVTYEESDMDIYVTLNNAEAVGVWLMSEGGYQYQPREGETFAEAAEAAKHYLRVDHSYEGLDHMIGVFNFLKLVFDESQGLTTKQRKIQILAAETTPMEHVLRFHSTVVMNVISWDRAYSLYPLTTLEFRAGLLTTPFYSNAKPAIEKYMKRGWSLIPDSKWLHNERSCPKRDSFSLVAQHVQSTFTRRPRWIADGYSWVLRLPLGGLDIPPGMLGDPCYVTSWQLEAACARGNFAACSLRVAYRFMGMPEFSNVYIGVGGKLLRIMDHVNHLSRQLHFGLPKGPNDRFCDDTLFRACQSLLEEKGVWDTWYPPQSFTPWDSQKCGVVHSELLGGFEL